MTLKEQLQLEYNVIMRDDGVVLLNELGDPNIYSINNDEGQRQIEYLHERCKRYKVNHTYKLVLYHSLPEQTKHRLIFGYNN
jgi:hypothetical protein